MSAVHVVVQGECLAAIARRYGFESYRALWAHPANAELRAKRRDPNVLFPGDRVHIPDREERVERAATGAVHTFQLRLPRKELRLVLRDAHDHPVANAPYVMVFDHDEARPREGITTAEGALSEVAPRGAAVAVLRIAERELRLRLGHLNPALDTPDRGVSGAQMRLRNLGYATGKVDGVLGPRTRAALAQFQRDEHLNETGTLDEGTVQRLIDVHGC